MQKPDVDIEELMASIIIILKSPNADLTWAKGAKRQMANIDRFLNELSTFHISLVKYLWRFSINYLELFIVFCMRFFLTCRLYFLVISVNIGAP